MFIGAHGTNLRSNRRWSCSFGHHSSEFGTNPLSQREDGYVPEVVRNGLRLLWILVSGWKARRASKNPTIFFSFFLASIVLEFDV